MHNILTGEELNYNYGNSDWPWQTKMNKIIPDDSDELFDSTPDSGEEYVPKSSESSSSDCSGSTEILHTRKLPHRVPDLSTYIHHLPDSITDITMEFEEGTGTTVENMAESEMSRTCSVNTADEERASTGAVSMEVDDTATVIINAVTKKRDGARVYNKKHYCLFCFKPFSKMARHLDHVHSNERAVVQACMHPKGSKERRTHLNHLRNRGNYAHNADVLKTGKGELVPKKRPAQQSQGKDYMHCVYCQGLLIRNVLWRHMRNCKLRPSDGTPKPGKTHVQSLCAFMEPASPQVSKTLGQLINNMHPDEITLAVKNDKCILQMGEYMLNKCGSNPKRHEHVRQKLRELGRLLITAKKVSPKEIKQMKDLIDPKLYRATVKAIQLTCGYNSKMETFKTNKLAHSLSKIAKLVESNGRIAECKDVVEKALSFQQVHATRWNELISAAALRNIEEEKWNMPTILPFTQDVQALHSCLDQKQQEYIQQLTAEPNALNWSYLAKVSLAEIILFNRRREGEVSSMPLTAYLSRDTSDPHEDVDWALSEVEKKLCRHFSRIETRGKRGRKVPILLTPKMSSALELLVQKREECGVLKDNVYVFARPSYMSHYRGSDCLRTFVKACGAKNPAALSSTKLRKHIATLSTVLNMNETEMDQLANFMGHDFRIHRQHYRLPEATLQLAKISKVLMALEQGRLGDFKGKNLDQIEIDPQEKVLAHSDDDEWRDEKKNPTTSGLAENPVTEEMLESEVMSPPRGVMVTPSRQSSEGRKAAKKRRWETKEVQAVERHMIRFIHSLRVP
ncbi:hypothetical protein CRUP_019921, partial [Coryphaenoides rupestris]